MKPIILFRVLLYIFCVHHYYRIFQKQTMSQQGLQLDNK